MASYVERPDRANEKASERNSAFFSAGIVEVAENFSQSTVPIYIYNVSPLEFTEPRYPNHPHMWIRPCPVGEDYVLANSITHPFPENYRDENGNLMVRWKNGYREATKMLSPANPGTDQNFEEVNPLNVGGNLNNFGVFWSPNNPPRPEEIAAAKARLAKTFKAELAELAKIESGVGGTNEAQARANNISHAAANYYGVSTSWHRSDLIPKTTIGTVACEICGENIKTTAKLCIHCGAPTDPETQERWLQKKLSPGPGRPAGAA